MKLRKPILCQWKMLSTVLPTVLLLVFAGQSDAALLHGQRLFLTPREAAEALIQAAAAYDVPVLLDILGPDAKDLVASDDPVLDKNRATAFAALARVNYSIAFDPKNHNRAELLVGNDGWPLPIPLVKRNGKLVLRFHVRASGDTVPPHRRK